MITVCARDGNELRLLPCIPVTFSKAMVIYHEGDPAEYWYEVVAGIVRTCRFLADGHRQLTCFFQTGDVFGIDGSNYLESAEAVTGVLLRRFPSKLLAEDDWATSAAHDHVMERALESARRSIFLFGHRTAMNRVAAFLIVMAQRSGEFIGVELPMSRSDIADHLNLTLHTVSRTISNLARKGLIALDGPQNIRILNAEGLRDIAGDPAIGDHGEGYLIAPP